MWFQGYMIPSCLTLYLSLCRNRVFWICSKQYSPYLILVVWTINCGFQIHRGDPPSFRKCSCCSLQLVHLYWQSRKRGFCSRAFPHPLGMAQWGRLQTQSTWGVVAAEGTDSHSLALASRHWILLCNCKHKGLTIGNLFLIWLLMQYGKITSNFSFEEFQCDLLASLSARRLFLKTRLFL